MASQRNQLKLSHSLSQEARLKITEKVEKMRSVAEYYTIDGLISMEMGQGGGAASPAAVKGAINRALRCISRMGKWVRVDEDSGRMEFRRVKKVEISDTSTTHRHQKEEKDKMVGNPDTQNATGTQDDTVTPEKSAAPAASGQQTADGKPGPEPVMPAPRPTTSGPRASAATASGKTAGKAKAKSKPSAKPKAKAKGKAKPVDANTVKRKVDQLSGYYHVVMSRADKRLKLIKDGANDWQWADTDKFRGRLEKYMSRASAALSEFPGLKSVVEDGVKLNEEALTNVTQSIQSIDKVQSALDNIDGQLTYLMTMHEQDAASASQ